MKAKEKPQARHETRVSTSYALTLLREGVIKPSAITVDGRPCRTLVEAERALENALREGKEYLN